MADSQTLTDSFSDSSGSDDFSCEDSPEYVLDTDYHAAVNRGGPLPHPTKPGTRPSDSFRVVPERLYHRAIHESRRGSFYAARGRVAKSLPKSIRARRNQQAAERFWREYSLHATELPLVRTREGMDRFAFWAPKKPVRFPSTLEQQSPEKPHSPHPDASPPPSIVKTG